MSAVEELAEQREASASLDDSANYPRMAWLSLRVLWENWGRPLIGLAGFVGVLLIYKYAGYVLAAYFGMEF